MIVLENKDTGETRLIESGQIFWPPWKVKTTVKNIEQMAQKAQQVAARAAYWANYPFRMCSNCHQKGVYEST